MVCVLKMLLGKYIDHLQGGADCEIEGDELYTRVNKKVAPDASQGWTVVLMDRATRFIWDM